jgi:hypothetical protein
MHQRYRDRWPKFFNRYEKGIADLFYKRQDQGNEMFFDTPQQFLGAWYLDSSARWYAEPEKQKCGVKEAQPELEFG